MGKLLYFASASDDQLAIDSDRFICSVQQSATTVDLFFKPATNDACDTDVVQLAFASGDHDVVMEAFAEEVNFGKDQLITVFDAVSGDVFHNSLDVASCTVTQDS